MDQVIRQDDVQFKSLLHQTRIGEMDDDSVGLLLSRCLHNMERKEHDNFVQEALHIMPPWAMTIKVTSQYLKSLNGPYTIIKTIYTSSSRVRINHFIKELLYPNISALYVGAAVMLMKNYIVEENLMNGYISTVIDIIYDHHRGPNQQKSLLLYVVVNFPQCTPSHKFIEGSLSTYIPIPATTDRCEKNCCSISTIPLRVVKAINMYKSQIITVGLDQAWEKVVV